MQIDWTLILTGVGSVITIIGFVYTMLRNFKADINGHIDRLQSDIKSCTNRLDGHAQRIDQLYHNSNAKHDAQLARIDKLYEMFCELLKDKKSH